MKDNRKMMQDKGRMRLTGRYRIMRCLICVLTVLALTVTGCKKTADNVDDKPAAGTENVTGTENNAGTGTGTDSGSEGAGSVTP
ncbi:MAG: hypothetical protein J6S72_01225, partial [Lachnospiraceae bacterium]|nr:hypothetical protein [Lachnospiraceae bacterium]